MDAPQTPFGGHFRGHFLRSVGTHNCAGFWPKLDLLSRVVKNNLELVEETLLAKNTVAQPLHHPREHRMRSMHPVRERNPALYPVATHLNLYEVEIAGQLTEAHPAIRLCRAGFHVDPNSLSYFGVEDTIIGPRID